VPQLAGEITQANYPTKELPESLVPSYFAGIVRLLAAASSVQRPHETVLELTQELPSAVMPVQWQHRISAVLSSLCHALLPTYTVA
jgi:hypothetical protein